MYVLNIHKIYASSPFNEFRCRIKDFSFNFFLHQSFFLNLNDDAIAIPNVENSTQPAQILQKSKRMRSLQSFQSQFSQNGFRALPHFGPSIAIPTFRVHDVQLSLAGYQGVAGKLRYQVQDVGLVIVYFGAFQGWSPAGEFFYGAGQAF